jgi:hypothetical protein
MNNAWWDCPEASFFLQLLLLPGDDHHMSKAAGKAAEERSFKRKRS